MEKLSSFWIRKGRRKTFQTALARLLSYGEVNGERIWISGNVTEIVFARHIWTDEAEMKIKIIVDYKRNFSKKLMSKHIYSNSA